MLDRLGDFHSPEQYEAALSLKPRQRLVHPEAETTTIASVIHSAPKLTVMGISV